MKKCPKCGEKNLKNAQFCSFCKCDIKQEALRQFEEKYPGEKLPPSIDKMVNGGENQPQIKRMKKLSMFGLLFSMVCLMWAFFGMVIDNPDTAEVNKGLIICGISLVAFIVDSCYVVRKENQITKQRDGEKEAKIQLKLLGIVFCLIPVLLFAVITIEAAEGLMKAGLFVLYILIGGTIGAVILIKNGYVPQSRIINHCPRCNSKDIVIYRKGYDWNKGFWYRMFNIKGGSYLAGMESNRAECCCNKCGKKWVTDYDYRTLRKK